RLGRQMWSRDKREAPIEPLIRDLKRDIEAEALRCATVTRIRVQERIPLVSIGFETEARVRVVQRASGRPRPLHREIVGIAVDERGLYAGVRAVGVETPPEAILNRIAKPSRWSEVQSELRRVRIIENEAVVQIRRTRPADVVDAVSAEP